MPPNKYNKLTSKQLQAINLYLNENRTYTDIAKEIGVTRGMLYEWRTNNDLFIKELNRQHEIMVRENASRNAYNFTFLDNALREIITNKKTPPKDKIDAIRTGYDVMLKKQQLLASVEFREKYEERMRAVEDAIELEGTERTGTEDGSSGEEGEEGQSQETGK